MLHTEVCRFAAALKKLGLKTGDRVAIYMPMIPEAAIAMLACARIGATHSIVFGGFSAEALRDRINDAEAQGRDHRRRRVAARHGRAAEGGRRCGAERDAFDREGRRREADRQRRHDADGTRPLVGRGDRRRARRLRGRAARQRASALHPLHERHDRKTEGRRAHDRRLPRARRTSRPSSSSTSRRPTSTGARPTSAG